MGVLRIVSEKSSHFYHGLLESSGFLHIVFDIFKKIDMV